MKNTMNNEITIESIDTKNIPEKDLQAIHEIEQDTWAYTIGEYVKCRDCGKINSKKDIYPDLPKDIFTQTVLKIEQIIGIDSIECSNCGSGNCEHIFGEDYINEIIDRYTNKIQSFLTVSRNKKGEIVGVQDGYISTFEDIFETELFYYKKLGEEYIKNLIEQKIGKKINGNIFMFSTMGTKKEASNLDLVVEQTRIFFKLISSEKENINLYMFEAKIGSVAQKWYSSWGCIPLGISENEEIYNNVSSVHSDSKSDIFIHTDILGGSKLL